MKDLLSPWKDELPRNLAVVVHTHVLRLCKDTNQLGLSGTTREPGWLNVFVFVVSSKQQIMNDSGGIILVPYCIPPKHVLCVFDIYSTVRTKLVL